MYDKDTYKSIEILKPSNMDLDNATNIMQITNVGKKFTSGKLKQFFGIEEIEILFRNFC